MSPDQRRILQPESGANPRVTGFDRLIAYAIFGIVALIVFTILLGDRVGVMLVRAAPLGEARATSPILIQFSEPMNRATLEGKLKVEPQVEGAIQWSGATLIFRPTRPLAAGQEYQVTLEAGGRSESGRQVLAEYRFRFSVRHPRVAYLAPADGAPLNIWVAQPGIPASARQVTATTGGVYDFAVSPDGQYIAYSETNPVLSTDDIFLLDLETGAARQLTNCVDASCTNPTWRPDGNLLAYERVDYNTGLENVGASPTRVWLLEVTSNPATTRPLFASSQVLGYDPQWSADGRRIAVFDRASASIFIWDFSADSGIAIPTDSGTSGALSPDGTRLVYPEVRFGENENARTILQMADLESNAIQPLPGTGDTSNDQTAVWSPDGSHLAIGRRFDDQRFSIGYQILLVDPNTGVTRALTTDDRYTNGFFSWDANGTALVVQRLPLLNAQGEPDNLARPEIWTLEVETGALTLVAENAFHPRWVP